jgi:hypothetical protein
MLRKILALAIFALVGSVSATAQVQTVGDVSFATLNGWQYQQGQDFGAMTVKTDNQFWLIAVYSAMPSSGNANADFKAAWRRVVLNMPGNSLPGYDPYNLDKTIGYQGKYYDGANSNNTTYTRLYVLEAGKSCIPVAFVSGNRQMLDGMEHNAKAVVGSVRLAPLKATPIKFSISVSDLPGHWTNGIVTSIDYYNSSGQYQTNSLSAMRFGYDIAADGSYTYKYGGLMNNRVTNGDDSGVVVLGDGFVTFKGRRYQSRYRFVSLQQALDGSTVLALWPDVDISRIDSTRDTTYYTRAASK